MAIVKEYLGKKNISGRADGYTTPSARQDTRCTQNTSAGAGSRKAMTPSSGVGDQQQCWPKKKKRVSEHAMCIVKMQASKQRREKRETYFKVSQGAGPNLGITSTDAV